MESHKFHKFFKLGWGHFTLRLLQFQGLFDSYNQPARKASLTMFDFSQQRERNSESLPPPPACSSPQKRQVTEQILQKPKLVLQEEIYPLSLRFLSKLKADDRGKLFGFGVLTHTVIQEHYSINQSLASFILDLLCHSTLPELERQALFFFLLAIPTACGSSQARDRTHTTATTQDTAVTKLDP